MSPGLALRRLLSPAPRPRFPQMYQNVHDVFVRLETRIGHVYNRCEEDVTQEGREHAPLTKALFHSEPPRVHPVVEPHACSHAIVETTNDRDLIMWHAKTGETVQRRVRSTESYALVRSIKHRYSGHRFFRANSCSRRITKIISMVERFGRKLLCSFGRIPTCSQHSLRPRAMIFSTSLAGVRYQRVTPVVATLCPILLFVEYHDDGIFPLVRHLSPPSNTNDDIEQSSTQDGIADQVDFQ